MLNTCPKCNGHGSAQAWHCGFTCTLGEWAEAAQEAHEIYISTRQLMRRTANGERVLCCTLNHNKGSFDTQ